jgi:Aspartyl protease
MPGRLLGRLGETTGRPYLSARIFIPRLRTTADVWFLVDTGADRTTVHPTDGARMRLDYSSLPWTGRSYGVGGISISHAVEQAVISFRARLGTTHYYRVPVLIAQSRDPANGSGVPSLLGRDILQRWAMHYAPMKKRYKLWFEVLSSDLTLPG